MASPVRRRSVRIPDLDYNAGSYLVTVCSAGRAHTFGTVHDGVVSPSPLGEIALAAWRDTLAAAPHIDEEAFVIMPNHAHFVVTISSRVGQQERHSRHGLAQFVGGFKARATSAASRATLPVPVWQRGFHERILVTDRQVTAAVRYVEANPDEWAKDPYR
jgi:putative transposase